MAVNNTLISKYMARPVVRQRNSVTLANFSAYVTAEAIPDAPDDAWIRMRIQAENIPLTLDLMVIQTLTYFMQDTTTQTNITQFISEDNDDTTEVSLSSQNDSILAAFAQRWCDTTVSPAQVTAWREQNGKPAPAAA
jgi:hypothetical protein